MPLSAEANHRFGDVMARQLKGEVIVSSGPPLTRTGNFTRNTSHSDVMARPLDGDVMASTGPSLTRAANFTKNTASHSDVMVANRCLGCLRHDEHGPKPYSDRKFLPETRHALTKLRVRQSALEDGVIALLCWPCAVWQKNNGRV